MTDEIPMTGGHVADSVVRVGDTIRKPRTAHDAATRALLQQLQSAQVTGVPQFIGIDDRNRQTLSFVTGSTDTPSNLWTQDRSLITAAQFLRRLHDASMPLVGAPLPWAYCYPDTQQHAVIGHSDFAPYNMTFDAEGSVVGVFDFDLAGPAPRSRDLAYLAWWMVPLGQQDPAMDAATQVDLAHNSQRLTQLCKTYGIRADTGFLNMIDHVLHHMSDPNAATKMIGAVATRRLMEDGHLDHWAQARANFNGIRPQIAANLGLASDHSLANT
jgi:hypothetical protein